MHNTIVKESQYKQNCSRMPKVIPKKTLHFLIQSVMKHPRAIIKVT